MGLEYKCTDIDLEEHRQTAKFMKRFFNKINVSEDEITRIAAILQVYNKWIAVLIDKHVMRINIKIFFYLS